MTIPLALLAVAIVAYEILRRSASQRRRSLGVENGKVIGADDSNLGLVTLRSERHRLIGRPDQILRAGRFYIPVEQKPSARRLYSSHAMQVAAQCILVQEVYGVRPPYGVVVLSGGRPERVAFTPHSKSECSKRCVKCDASLRQARIPVRAGWLRNARLADITTSAGFRKRPTDRFPPRFPVCAHARRVRASWTPPLDHDRTPMQSAQAEQRSTRSFRGRRTDPRQCHPES